MLDRPQRDQISNELIARWQSHRDERARDRLTSLHWPLIRMYGARLARKFGVDVDDATQEAALGFLRALDTYTPELGTLATYVHTWARQRVRRHRDDTEGTIRVPVHVRDRNLIMTRTFAKLRRALGRPPSLAEMAADLRWPEERLNRVREAHRVTGPLQSTSTPIGEGEDMELGDIIAADEDTRPDVTVLGRHGAAQARVAILQAAELLPERWRIVLALRVVEGRTLEATAERLGVTRERTRQIETRVIARLREALRYDPRALNLIGLEVEAPDVVTRADDGGLGVADIMAMTGLTACQIDHAIRTGAFPRPCGNSYSLGPRLWDPEIVTKWVARRDAASASTAANDPSPGIDTPRMLARR